MTKTRRVAAHEVRLPDGRTIAPGVVEITSGMAEKAYPLEGEPAHTEWLGGTIVIRSDNRAYKDDKPIET